MTKPHKALSSPEPEGPAVFGMSPTLFRHAVTTVGGQQGDILRIEATRDGALRFSNTSTPDNPAYVPPNNGTYIVRSPGEAEGDVYSWCWLMGLFDEYGPTYDHDEIVWIDMSGGVSR